MTPTQREAALRLIAEHPTLFMNDLPDWCDDAFHLLRELLAEPQGEPVAWWIPKAEQFALAKKDGSRPFAKSWEPLYTHPPQQRKPFSHAQMADLIRAEWGIAEVPSAWNFGRAIERAHGIVEAP